MDVADLAHYTYKVLENVYLYSQSIHLLDQDFKKPSLPNNKTAVSRPSYLLGIVWALFWVSF